jgi:hypothetical protein
VFLPLSRERGQHPANAGSSSRRAVDCQKINFGEYASKHPLSFSILLMLKRYYGQYISNDKPVFLQKTAFPLRTDGETRRPADCQQLGRITSGR